MEDFLVEFVRSLGPGMATLIVGLVTTWYAARASRMATEAADEAKKLAVTTNEMSGRLDGKLDELKRLWQAEAAADARADALEEARATAAGVAEQVKVDKQIEREEAKADRAEGAASVPTEVTVTNPDPIAVVLEQKSKDEPVEPKDK